MDIKQLHHVAYRCRDAKQTVEFYTRPCLELTVDTMTPKMRGRLALVKEAMEEWTRTKRATRGSC